MAIFKCSKCGAEKDCRCKPKTCPKCGGTMKKEEKK
ncbi:MAG: rubredoxin [Nitrospirae bacterium]|nr:rubredoxin [Nitrospirota bacterium]MBF0542427.1 rubredoxin [Nitrospirota bacterium]